MASMQIFANQRQSQAIAPRLQQAVRLLQMSTADFALMLRESLDRNPFLEIEEEDAVGPQEVVDDAESWGLDSRDEFEAESDAGNAIEVDLSADRVDDEPLSSDREFDPGFDVGIEGADFDDDRGLWQAEGGTGPRAEGDGGDYSALDHLAVNTPLNSHLHAQLSLLPLTLRDAVLARAVIESLDDDGYLRTALEELVDVVGLHPQASPDELALALTRVQSLEPAGVGARSVAECLQLQLPAIACPKMRALASRIVSGHLDALALRDINGLARKLGVTAAEVEGACDRIRRFDPRPGHAFGSVQAPYVVPDVIVRKVRGQWSVQLNPAVVPRLRLNQVYANLYSHHRNTGSAELGAHLQEARWTLRNVDQRFSTILEVARAIVRRQRNFLECGTMAMKPLGLKEIAEEVGVHESTVSRVTNNKFMATPIGLFELKYFFSRAMISANGSACSGTAIRSLVEDIIAAEDVARPVSDAEITRQLAVQGLMVARRTVTKYRQMLKIDAVDKRRRHS